MNPSNRQFIRHPSEIPIEYCMTSAPPRCNTDVINNISQGGLSFHANAYIEPEQWIHLYIPIHENYFEADAKVCWCKQQVSDNQTIHYDVGVEFSNKDEAFSARMVEQVCYIEQYRERVKQREGRRISSDQAAAEWIEKYAQSFPNVAG